MEGMVETRGNIMGKQARRKHRKTSGCFFFRFLSMGKIRTAKTQKGGGGGAENELVICFA
jgi:hypothetical protein